MSRLSRRGFLKTSLAVAGGAALAGGRDSQAQDLRQAVGPATKVRGANEMIRVAVAGVHGPGVGHLQTCLFSDTGVTGKCWTTKILMQ